MTGGEVLDRAALVDRLEALGLSGEARLVRDCGLALLCEPPVLAIVGGLVSALERERASKAGG